MLKSSIVISLSVVLITACADAAPDETADAAEAAQVAMETETDAAADDAQEPDTAWLHGPWVVDGEHCQGDSGITYYDDGTYVVYGEFGTWELDGDQLILTTTSTAEPGEPGTTETMEDAEPYIWTISDQGDESFVQTLPDGTALTMNRCPAVD